MQARDGRVLTWLGAGLAAIVLGLLALNPGYFSHDELQWGAYAAGPSWDALPWQDFRDIGLYQYRPLTFDAWLVLSRLLFDTPRLMHIVWILLGLGNAALLFLVLRNWPLPRSVALAGAVLFLLCPYAVFVHGWVATLADLLWVGIALALLAWLLARPAPARPSDAIALVCAGTLSAGVALLCKEAALSLPLLLVVGFARSRDARLGWAALGAGVAAGAYLLVRAEVVLGAAPAQTGYDWSVVSVPLRFLDYHLFPFDIRLLEVVSFPMERTALRVAALLLCVGTYALAFRSVRALAWVLAASAASLGPVLILDNAFNQYGYALAALLAAVLVGAWHSGPPMARRAVVTIAVLWTLHSVQIAWEMHRVGSIQSRFSPAIVHARAEHAGSIEISPACIEDEWIYRRLLHGIPAYNGISVGSRARLVDPAGTGERDVVPLIVDCRGNLQPPEGGSVR